MGVKLDVGVERLGILYLGVLSLSFIFFSIPPASYCSNALMIRYPSGRVQHGRVEAVWRCGVVFPCISSIFRNILPAPSCSIVLIILYLSLGVCKVGVELYVGVEKLPGVRASSFHAFPQFSSTSLPPIML